MNRKAIVMEAKALAAEASRLIRSYADTSFTVENKRRFDLVTDADRAAEDLIVNRLAKRFPQHGILAEEGGRMESGSDRLQWIIDPLDGTTNFAHGFPYWSVSIAWAEEGVVEVGAVADAAGRCFWAERGHGAYLDQKPIFVSTTDSLRQSLLVTGFSYTIDEDEHTNLEAFSRLTVKTQGVRRTGSAALDLCMTAMGAFDAYWEYALNAWDMAAGSLIVEEAGGRVTKPDGSPLSLDQGAVLASNGVLHDAVINELS